MNELLMPLKKGGDEPAVYIVPSAGSTPLSLTKLAHASDYGRPLWAFVPPGIDDGKFSYKSVGDLAEVYLENLLAVDSSGPFYIAGHCVGGFVALELVNRLRATGHAVAGLALLESFPPSRIRSTDDGRVRETVSDTALLEGETARLLKLVSEHVLGQFSGLPRAHAERFGRITQDYLGIGEIYLPLKAEVPVTLLRTNSFDAAVFDGWRNVTSGRVTVDLIPGGTYSMLSPPYVSAVAKRFDAALRNF